MWLSTVACADVGAPPLLAGDSTTAADHDSIDHADLGGSSTTAAEPPSGRDAPRTLRRDRYVTVMAAELSIRAADGVLANDDGGDLLVTGHDARTRAGGELHVAANGALTYRPPADFTGCDHARYAVGDDDASIVFAVRGPGALGSPTEIDTIAAQAEGLAAIGEAAGHHSGGAVTIVGDMNGDGRSELAIAAAEASPRGRAGAGRVHVVAAAERRGTLDLAQLDGDGFAIDGDVSGAHAGERLAPAGDVDGDGLADLMLAAPRTNLGAGPQGDHVGRVFVVFGRPDLAAVDLADMFDPTTDAPPIGQAFTGEFMGDHAGAAIAPAGDVDGDGLDDLVVGAPLWGPAEQRPGRVYLVYSRATPGSWRFDQMLASGHAVAIDGVGEAQLGRVVAGIGDVDGDGTPEFAIGSPHEDAGRGRVWIIDDPGVGGDIETLAAAGHAHALDGEGPHDGFGTAIAAIGDGSLAVGAPGWGDDRGRAWVLEDSAIAAAGVPQLGAGAIAIDGDLRGIFAGSSLAAAGDLDDDGALDLWIGAGLADGGAGRAYAVFLGGARTTRSLASVASGAGGVLLRGNAKMGTARAIAGGVDLDDDGVPDAVIGSPGADDVGSYSGRADLVPGAAAVCE